jgi:16S rRNA (adenine1518-N6/adenine1519-N6)-dimethyltransferase
VAGELIEPDLWERLHWIEADAMGGGRRLSEPMQAALEGADRMVSNLPYNVAAPLMAAAVLQRARRGCGPERFSVLIQKELGQRMTARASQADYGPLAVLLQLAADVAVLRKVPSGAFWPAPKVESVVVEVVPKGASGPDLVRVPGLETFLGGAFGQRRKTLVNSLAGVTGESTAEVVERLGLPEKWRRRRAEAFDALELYNLAAHWAQPSPGERTRHDP